MLNFLLKVFIVRLTLEPQHQFDGNNTNPNGGTAAACHSSSSSIFLDTGRPRSICLSIYLFVQDVNIVQFCAEFVEFFIIIIISVIIIICSGIKYNRPKIPDL